MRYMMISRWRLILLLIVSAVLGFIQSFLIYGSFGVPLFEGQLDSFYFGITLSDDAIGAMFTVLPSFVITALLCDVIMCDYEIVSAYCIVRAGGIGKWLAAKYASVVVYSFFGSLTLCAANFVTTSVVLASGGKTLFLPLKVYAFIFILCFLFILTFTAFVNVCSVFISPKWSFLTGIGIIGISVCLIIYAKESGLRKYNPVINYMFSYHREALKYFADGSYKLSDSISVGFSVLYFLVLIAALFIIGFLAMRKVEPGLKENR